MNEEYKQILKKLTIAFVIIVFFFVSTSSIYKIIYAPELEEQKIAKERIKVEYANLNIPPGSKQLNSHYNDRGGRIYVSLSGSLYTEKKWEDIRDFYTEEAQRNSWVFWKDGEDEKSNTISFRKEKYKLSCTYLKAKSEYIIILFWAADPKDLF